MSLVNDMLKDLDARRRGAPVKGNAAKKLTPASDRRGLVARSQLPLVAGLFGSVVIVVRSVIMMPLRSPHWKPVWRNWKLPPMLERRCEVAAMLGKPVTGTRSTGVITIQQLLKPIRLAPIMR